MKTNGATWNAYLASWPDGQWFDDSNETYDGIPGDVYTEKTVPDDAIVEFTYGIVYASETAREGTDLVRHFSAWKRAQTVATVMVDVPKASLDEFRQAVAALGAKVREA